MEELFKKLKDLVASLEYDTSALKDKPFGSVASVAKGKLKEVRVIAQEFKTLIAENAKKAKAARAKDKK